MSKNFLLDICNEEQADKYVWNIFYYAIHRKSKDLNYSFYKIRFQNENYALTYAKELMKLVNIFQINELENIQEYDGYNTKTSCDKISLNNDLIAYSWNKFIDALANASDEINKTNNWNPFKRDEINIPKTNGYVLYGEGIDENKSITFIKIATPFVNLKNKPSVVFTTNNKEELGLFSDTVCRLYLNTDILITNDTMYTFNLKFEKLFNIKSTIKNIQTKAIDAIADTNCFLDVESFKNYASKCSKKIFLTLDSTLVNKIKDKGKREDIVKSLKEVKEKDVTLNLDNSGNFIIDCEEKANILIKYLCRKIIVDKETDVPLEVSSALPLVKKIK